MGPRYLCKQREREIWCKTMSAKSSEEQYVSENDIFHENSNSTDCKKSIEYTPVKVDPKKLKKYFVPYIEMTHENITAGTEEQLKVRYENCNDTHFQLKNFSKDA